MTFIPISSRTDFSSYGANLCRFCSLTVAEYLNGRLYPVSTGDFQYIHDACYHQAALFIPCPSGEHSIRPPPTMQQAKC